MATQALPYTYLTFAAARQQLANRLFDPTKTFWVDAELGVYVVEALQTWNALTGYWRGDFTFQSRQAVTWYSLVDTTAMPNTLRPLTVTDANLYTTILYHLLEPTTGPVSLQLTTDDLVNAVQRRRDECLSTSSCTQTRRLVGAVNGRITLPDTVIDVRRMAYLPGLVTRGGFGSGYFGQGIFGISLPDKVQGYIMWPEDTWGEQSFDRLYTLRPPGKPLTYIMSTQPPLSFDTDRPPDSAGQYELLTVEAGGTLSFTAPSTLLVPDDWTHVIKWGALADLFNRESNAKDALRAQYCEQRYRMGLTLLAKAPALLAMRLNNVALQIDAVRGADLYNTTWQSKLPQQPKAALHSGLNLVALAPTPDAGPAGTGQPYMLTATVVENAPVPILDGDQVQVGRDDLDAILDYAVHLASLKMGGAEFLATMPLMERFLKQASIYGLKLSEIAEYTSILYGLSQVEHNMHPVTAEESA